MSGTAKSSAISRSSGTRRPGSLIRLPFGVHRKTTISVTVVGDAGVRPVQTHGLPERVHVGGTATLIDFVAIGGIPDRDHLGTGTA